MVSDPQLTIALLALIVVIALWAWGTRDVDTPR